MSLNDPLAACDRLAAIFDRALALREQGPTAVDDAVRVPVVQYAIAQLKMRVRPALEKDWLKADPVHVVLFGGTNTGKSTVLNVLLGRDGAGMSVRARFSQYPEAFRPAALGDRWLDSFPSRFAGYRRYRDEHPPHLSDEALCRDGYAPALAVIDPAHLDAEPMAAPAAPGAVLWDTPDFSTEQAWTYFRAVLDAAALADVVVMTVTDESYADDRGNALLRMLGESGVAVHVAANKLGDSATLLDDIAKTLETIGQSRAPIHRLPHVAGTKPGERLRGLLATREASAFRAAIAREAARGAELKRSGLLGAVGLLRRHLEEVLRPLVSEADVAARWASAVERITRDRLIEPYRRDYLEGIRHAEFNRALVHVMGLLQVPYIGPVLDLIGRAIRFPVRLASDTFRRLSGTPAPSETSPPEEQVV
ncbi:MAG: 50S ribosome-binding GTPase, partial [Planctomycetaceae bacterium]|nr:50S ribosome-binding GTPase [Planctomycetaceae bacterium]